MGRRPARMQKYNYRNTVLNLGPINEVTSKENAKCYLQFIHQFEQDDIKKFYDEDFDL